MKHSRVLIAVALALSLTWATLWMLGRASGPALAESDLVFTPPSLARQHTPVIITGGLFPDLIGSPVDEIFVYAYQGTIPTQIPSQIDERGAAGMHVAFEDGQLDDDDELVFMAQDGGGWVDHPLLDAGDTSINPAYAITITDLISDTYAWAYVFRSADLSRTTTDYVSYDGGSGRITSPDWYALGFDPTHGFLNYLVLGDGSSNLFDQSKIRITGTLDTPYGPLLLSADEEDVVLDAVHFIDGPVRVTRVSTSTQPGIDGSVQSTATIFAYRSLVVQPTTIAVPGTPAQIDYVRTSLDWNERSTGMMYYDANNPTGVGIDGISDAITTTPPSRWMQVTGLTGTVVNVGRVPAGLGGTQSTYYKDDSAIDGNDTGDQRSYGDAGFQVLDPTPGTYTMLGHIYFLTGTAANVGDTYVRYYDHPLEVSVEVFTPQWCLYLPVVVRNSAVIRMEDT